MKTLLEHINESVIKDELDLIKDSNYTIIKVVDRNMRTSNLKNSVININELEDKILSGNFPELEFTAFDVSSLDEIQKEDLLETIMQFLYDGINPRNTAKLFGKKADFIVCGDRQFLRQRFR